MIPVYGGYTMKQNKALLKILHILLTIITIVLALSVLWLVVLAILQANDVPIPMRFDETGIAIGNIEVSPAQPQVVRITTVLMLIPVNITGFFVFYLLRSIIADMLKGVRFESVHVKRIRIIALLIAFQGVWESIYPIVYSTVTGTHRFSIELFNEKYLWALVVVALAEVFAHGVNLQIDSDMTV